MACHTVAWGQTDAVLLNSERAVLTKERDSLKEIQREVEIRLKSVNERMEYLDAKLTIQKAEELLGHNIPVGTRIKLSVGNSSSISSSYKFIKYIPSELTVPKRFWIGTICRISSISSRDSVIDVVVTDETKRLLRIVDLIAAIREGEVELLEEDILKRATGVDQKPHSSRQHTQNQKPHKVSTHTFINNVVATTNECIKLKPEKPNKPVRITDKGNGVYVVDIGSIVYSVRYSHTESNGPDKGYSYTVITSSNSIPMEREILALTKLSEMAAGKAGYLIIYIDGCNNITIDCQ
jgi:hypothetical protein